MPIDYAISREHTFDLLVIGGGMAGLCTAVAAARQGAKVGIVQDRPVFGGNCSSEIRVVPHGTAHSNSWGQETGLPHAIILEDRSNNHECFFDHGMINSGFDLTMMEFARREPNLTSFFNTTIRAVESEFIGVNEGGGVPTLNGLGRIGGGPRRITAVRGSQMGSEKEFVFRAKQFVDGTGDGTVGFLGGADFRYGREARSEFRENLAPLVSDDTTMGSTITMRARDIGREVPFTPPPWIQVYKTLEEIGNKRSLYHLDKPVYGGYWWLEICNPYHQIDDNQQIRDELHRHVLGVWNFIKNYSAYQEVARTYVLDWIGMVPGKRESRRLVGDVLVTERDCHNDRNWPDSIAYAGWWIDLHMKGGILNKVDPGERENVDRNYKHWIRIPPFSLPLRAFYSCNVENLWMVGRCLSVTHVALGPVRNMQTLGMMGHAVGIAAAYALKNNLTPRETAAPNGPHLSTIRQQMLRDDVRILGLRNADPRDFALSAKTSASSEATLDLSRPRPDLWFRLGTRRPGGPMASPALAMVLPLSSNRIERVSFFLKNETSVPVRLTAGIQRLERIWDRPDQPPLGTAPLKIPASFTGWVEAEFALEIEAGYPYRIYLTDGDGVAWACAEEDVPGTTLQYLHVCTGGPEEKNNALPSLQAGEVDLPAYRHWRQIPRSPLAIRVTPESRPFGAQAINNGFAWVDSMPNLWISNPTQPLPQWVELNFEREVSISAVDVSFDTNLSRITQSAAGFFAAPECVRDWSICVRSAGEWHIVFSETGNVQRKRFARFAPIIGDALRIHVLATNGDRSARIYEVRAYSS